MLKAIRCEHCGRFMPVERAQLPIEETVCERCAARDPRVWDGDRFVRESELARQRRAEMVRGLTAGL